MMAWRTLSGSQRDLALRPVVTGAAVRAGYLALALAVAGWSWVQTWSRLGVPSINPPFADLDVITATLDAVARGEPPYRIRAFEGRPLIFNYPHSWLALGEIGLRARHTFVAGC